MGKRGPKSVLKTRKDPPENRETGLADKWVVDAWNLWVGGLRSWSAIGRQVGHTAPTVRKHVGRYSETLAALLNGSEANPLAEYLQGLLQDLQHQTTLAGTAVRVAYVKGERLIEPDHLTRSRARKEVTNIRQLIAAAQGVVTERKGVDLRLTEDIVFRVVIGGADEDGGNPVSAASETT